MIARFLKERRALEAIRFSSNPVMLMARSNDCSCETVFAHQVEAYAEPGGVLLGLSTSGNSKNVVLALEAARAAGMATTGSAGERGGSMAPLHGHLSAVPSRSTPAVEQVDLALYHWFCAAGDEEAAVAADG